MDITPIITGLVTGVGVSVVAFILGRRLERERWDRDDRIRREDLERQRADRWLDVRRELFARFLAGVEEIREMGRQAYLGELDELGPAWIDAYNLTVEIALIEPELEVACDRVYEAACLITSDARIWDAEHQDDAEDPPALEARETPLNDAIVAFMDAARARLGTASGKLPGAPPAHG